MQRHELFDLLDVIKPKWRVEYKTLRSAALAAGVLAEYNDYLQTPAGIHYLQHIATAHDHAGDNEKRRAAIEAEIALASQAGFRFRGAAE